MKTIALITDFGTRDNFVGVMKGVILRVNPNITIIDITHDVPPQDISTAAFLLKTSYKYFPKGTIFLAVVDPGVGSTRNAIIIKSKNYYFIGPDNGILAPAASEDSIEKVVEIENSRFFLKPVSNTFHGRDIFAPVAAYLSRGKTLSQFGESITSLKKLELAKPKADKNRLQGGILHIDRFGNLISNIDKDLFESFAKNKSVKIKIKGKEFSSLARFYQEKRRPRLFAIFGSFGLLEISLRDGNAQRYLNASVGTAISIERGRS